MIFSLSSRLCLGHLSHRTATIQKCGGGTFPNKPPSFNSQLLNKVHTGKWHRLTSRQLLKDANDVLCDIIFFRPHSCFH
jgi:hypothetical protein